MKFAIGRKKEKPMRFKIGQKIVDSIGIERTIVEVLENTVAILTPGSSVVTWEFQPHIRELIKDKIWKLLEQNEFIL